MGQDKKQLTKLLAFVKELYEHPDNKEFAAGIRDIVKNDKDHPVLDDTPSLKRISSYLSLDYELDDKDFPDYSFIDEDPVRESLLADFREMLRYQYGTRSHKIDFPEFCTYYWDGLESSVLDQMVEESDIGSAEIEEYYSSMEEPMYTDGEKVSYYLYTTDGSLPDVKNGERESLELTFGEIRDYIRQYGVEENVFLNFEKNQVNLLYSEAGKNVYIQFAELQKDTDLSDEDQGMIRSRIVEEQYEKELDAVVKKWGL